MPRGTTISGLRRAIYRILESNLLKASTTPVLYSAMVSGLLVYIAVPRFLESSRQKTSKPETNLILSLDGATLYRSYCAACHGLDGTGGGPSAEALKKAVPDLTRISQRNGGRFPMPQVQQTISGEVVRTSAHGSREMPIWGPIFGQIDWDQDWGKIRIYNLAKYLESLQEK